MGAADRAYIEALFLEYRTSIRNYVARMLPGGYQEADAVLQETYVKVLALQDLQPLRESPRAYLYTVATNLVRDGLRRHMRRKADQHECFEESNHTSPDPSPEGSAEWQQSLQQMKQALLRLKPVVRKVFLMSRFEEMTYPEIAAALSISTRSVERHMSAAMKHLQAELNELL
ncbi:RNA polymerase sigma factor [Microbulbifer mangrovi]|uniref:RNA polymerase sigma factor n=1 Tax=Microbulbifer mangrovi TaxID=927787 RepID=UPI001300F9F3|nr:RNA polymerase sigma factor [Microbulbifer mangrovi]